MSEDKLFLLPDGRPLKRDRLEKRLKVLTQKAGLSGSWHSLRRGCLTYFNRKGLPRGWCKTKCSRFTTRRRL